MFQVLEHSASPSVVEKSPIPVAMMTLGQLAEHIAHRGEEEALAELHKRTPFIFNGHGPCRLVEFIDHLRRQAAERNGEHADKAYDLTIDKFSRIVGDGCHWRGELESLGTGRTARTDCRWYFAAYVRFLGRKQQTLDRMTGLEKEMFEAKSLQLLIRRHYQLSLHECCRSAFMTRYVWRLPDGDLTVLMPRSISGRARRRWLQTNVGEVDLQRPDEQARVQAIIDAQIGQLQFFQSSGDEHWPSKTSPIPGEETFMVSVEGLADTVAKEKAGNICEQRRAIQVLGAVRLEEMIRQNFDQLADDAYQLKEVAWQYGISEATLSRFAGVRWARNNRMGSAVPDLWRNTAKVIGSDPNFVEAAKSAGVWKQIEQANEASP